MITGPQLYWIIEIGNILTNDEAVVSDGLWDGLDKTEKGQYNESADMINELFKRARRCP